MRVFKNQASRRSHEDAPLNRADAPPARPTKKLPAGDTFGRRKARDVAPQPLPSEVRRERSATAVFAAAVGSASSDNGPLKPDSPAFARRRKEVLKRTFDAFPKVDLTRIQDLNVLDTIGGRHNFESTTGFGEGMGWVRLARGVLDGREVFIKVSAARIDDGSEGQARKASHVLNELRWKTLCNDLGFGAKTLGWAVTEDGHYATLSEYVDGVHFPGAHSPKDWSYGAEGLPLPDDFTITDPMLEQITEMGSVLDAAGCFGRDMQFKLKTGRAVLVDVDLFMDAPGTEGSSMVAKDIVAQLKKLRR